MRRAQLMLPLLITVGSHASGAGAEAGGVVGRVEVGVEGVDLERLGRIVIFLEASAPAAAPAPTRVRRIHQRDARFSPDFLVVIAGESLEMPNDDVIFHNVFSYSKPNDFDLGVYPQGESRQVQLRYPGIVRIYCSIHDSMNGTIFVVPSPHYAIAAPDGSFEISGVAPGSYTLHAWSRRLPSAALRVEVSSGRVTAANLTIRSHSARVASPSP